MTASTIDLSALPDPLPIRSGGPIGGSVSPPGSKSVSHRYLNLALLLMARARLPQLEIQGLLQAEDTELFLEAITQCGLDVKRVAGGVRLIAGAAALGTGQVERKIHCGNAGTMYRFLVAALTAVPGNFRIDGTPRLRERPVGALVAALRQLGARIECLENEGYAPLRVEGASLIGGVCELDASQSSQYLSALLMAASGARRPVRVKVHSLVSAPYVDVTLQAMRDFGLRELVVEETAKEEASSSVFRVEPSQQAGNGPTTLETVAVEADYSAAAYPAAAALITSGEVRILGLEPDSPQGDRGFLEILTQLGAEVLWVGSVLHVRGGGALRAAHVDLSTMPDQVPTLAALAAFARGETRILNVAHLRIKESDRLRAMALELSKVGVDIRELPDGLVIRGRPDWLEGREVPREPVTIDPHNDHRIAMSLSLVGLRRPGIKIASPAVVAKSYPSFWGDMEALGGEGKKSG